MAESDFRFTTQIGALPKTVFEIVADLPNYGKWLPHSDAFAGMHNVTPYPVRVGTTYLEAPPIEKPGVVTEFDPPSHIGFHQIAKIRRPINVDVDARIRYSFEPRNGGTSVIRELRLTWDLPGLFKIATPLLILGFRRENLRTLAQLKRYAESQ